MPYHRYSAGVLVLLVSVKGCCLDKVLASHVRQYGVSNGEVNKEAERRARTCLCHHYVQHRRIAVICQCQRLSIIRDNSFHIFHLRRTLVKVYLGIRSSVTKVRSVVIKYFINFVRGMERHLHAIDGRYGEYDAVVYLPAFSRQFIDTVISIVNLTVSGVDIQRYVVLLAVHLNTLGVCQFLVDGSTGEVDCRCTVLQVEIPYSLQPVGVVVRQLLRVLGDDGIERGVLSELRR